MPGEDAVITATVTGPGTLRLRYLLLDPAVGEVGRQGQAEPSADGDEFAVTIPADVTASLFPGFYQLYLAAESDSLAAHHRAARGPGGAAVAWRPTA